MVYAEDEYFFQCPYCWQEISMLLDLSTGEQSYVEDCEICCNPIQIFYQVEDDQIVYFEAQPSGG
jgi:transcription elongation factor Elf1